MKHSQYYGLLFGIYVAPHFPLVSGAVAAALMAVLAVRAAVVERKEEEAK